MGATCVGGEAEEPAGAGSRGTLTITPGGLTANLWVNLCTAARVRRGVVEGHLEAVGKCNTGEILKAGGPAGRLLPHMRGRWWGRDAGRQRCEVSQGLAPALQVSVISRVHGEVSQVMPGEMVSC